MIQNLRILFFTVLSILISEQAALSQADLLRTEIEKIIIHDTEISYKKTPGFIIGIIDGDSTYTFSFGKKQKSTKSILTDTDVFEAGSSTKIFTALLTDILVQQKKLRYTDKINDYIPETYINPRCADITIADLINHQSGMPRRPDWFGKQEKEVQNPYAHYNTEHLLSFYRDFIPEKKAFTYAHTNYALLEVIIEEATGSNLGDLMDSWIFKPLGMAQSFIDFPERKKNLVTIGYDRAGKETQPWEFESFKASEGLKISLQDMLVFLKAIMSVYPAYVLDYDFNQWQSEADYEESTNIFKGWQILDLKNYRIYSHSGKTSGHTSFVAMVPDTRTAVVIFANSSIGTEDLGIQILRMINYNWKRKAYKS
ncbi:MAG: beta-lactamase family protein [Saprospiraceae bacterium]|nr:beta-lactamase family protein [Saprospiraceae bacterium]